jgi:hypothetical protein
LLYADSGSSHFEAIVGGGDFTFNHFEESSEPWFGSIGR